MGVFEMVIAVIAIVFVYAAWETWLKQRHRRLGSTKGLQEFAARLDRIEKRLSNIETITLDQERYREFDDSLAAGTRR